MSLSLFMFRDSYKISFAAKIKYIYMCVIRYCDYISVDFDAFDPNVVAGNFSA